MSRVVHFEIQADDVDRAKAFYAAAFGWEFQDYGEMTGTTYWGVVTGPEDEPGINGGLQQRPVPAPGPEPTSGTKSWAAPVGAITNGAPDNGEHPFVGELLFYVPDAEDSRFDDPGGWFTCPGTLIDDKVVLPAGHCAGISYRASPGSGAHP